MYNNEIYFKCPAKNVRDSYKTKCGSLVDLAVRCKVSTRRLCAKTLIRVFPKLKEPPARYIGWESSCPSVGMCGGCFDCKMRTMFHARAPRVLFPTNPCLFIRLRPRPNPPSGPTFFISTHGQPRGVTRWPLSNWNKQFFFVPFWPKAKGPWTFFSIYFLSPSLSLALLGSLRLWSQRAYNLLSSVSTHEP